MSVAQLLWAPQAWVGSGWQAQVLLDVDAQGRFHQVQPGVPAPAAMMSSARATARA